MTTRCQPVNDSEGEASLYALNASSGSLIRKTIIRNAVNVGNNYASRDTLSFTGEVTRTRSGLSSHDCEAILVSSEHNLKKQTLFRLGKPKR